MDPRLPTEPAVYSSRRFGEDNQGVSKVFHQFLVIFVLKLLTLN